MPLWTYWPDVVAVVIGATIASALIVSGAMAAVLAWVIFRIERDTENYLSGK